MKYSHGLARGKYRRRLGLRWPPVTEIEIANTELMVEGLTPTGAWSGGITVTIQDT